MSKQNISEAEIAAFLANGGKVQKVAAMESRQIPAWVADYLAKCPNYTPARAAVVREALAMSEGSHESVGYSRWERAQQAAFVGDKSFASDIAAGFHDPDSVESARMMGLSVTEYRNAIREAKIREKHGLL